MGSKNKKRRKKKKVDQTIEDVTEKRDKVLK
jgi:hypothetical protein